jgi:uncharacterized membrane protein YesL
MLNGINENAGNQEDNRKESAMGLYFEFLFNTSFDLIKLNCLFLLACIPVITIPAAVTGLSWVVSLMVRNKEYRVWKDFWKRFRSDFGQSLIFGVLSTIIYYLSGVSILYYIVVMQSSWMGPTLMILIGIIIAIPIMMSLYFFSLIATVNLSPLGIIKNAFVLSFLNLRKNSISLMLFAAAVALTVRFYPLSLGIYILPIIPSLRFVDLYLQFPEIEKYIVTKN